MIRTTAKHPFYAHEKGWVNVNELSVGDWLLDDEGRWLPVEDLLETGEFEPVYNCRIADYHTYFVGAEGWGFAVWAHNACSAAQQLAQSAQNSRASLRRAMGGVPIGKQAHHLMPLELRDHPALQRAAQGGFGINSKANGVLLGKGVHNGSHAQYTAAISKKLDQIVAQGGSTAQMASKVQAYANQVRAGLQKTTAKLH